MRIARHTSRCAIDIDGRYRSFQAPRRLTIQNWRQGQADRTSVPARGRSNVPPLPVGVEARATALVVIHKKAGPSCRPHNRSGHPVRQNIDAWLA